MNKEQKSKAANASFASLAGMLLGHSNRVWSIASTKDDAYVLTGSSDKSVKVWNLSERHCIQTLEGHQDSVYSVVLTSDDRRALSASGDKTLVLWDLESRKPISTIDGYDGKTDLSHSGFITWVEMGADDSTALSSSVDNTIKLWDLRTKQCLRTFTGHTNGVFCTRMSSDNKTAFSASSDHTLKRWNLDTGECLNTYKGHTDAVVTLAVTPDEKQMLSGSVDKTVKLWDAQSGRCLATFEGHTRTIRALAMSPTGKFAVSASVDKTIRFWKVDTGACLAVLQGEGEFTSAAFNSDGTQLFAGIDNGDIYVYALNNNEILRILSIEPEVRYTNAKVVLLGESGVGKSGLAYRLAEDRWVVTSSTHGMQVWPFKLSPSKEELQIEREVWLWDMAGQPEYRLIHQLFLEETALALILFNPQADDPFEGLFDWENGLRLAVGHDPVKFLVAARIDRGGATITPKKIKRFCSEHGFAEYFATSAKLENDSGCEQLRDALVGYIPWQRLPWISTTHLFKTLKDTLIRFKDEGLVMVRFSDLQRRMKTLVVDEPFDEDELRTVVGLLAGQGLIKRLDFGDFILLQPEQINNYATSVIRAAREHVDGIGCIAEEGVLNGGIDFKDMPRLGNADEMILLRAMVQTFLDQSLCIREETPSGVQLVFPSQFNREIEIPTHPLVMVSYHFSGHLPTIYTTLVVRLTYGGTFEKKELWKNAAEFVTPEGKTVGLVMKKIDEGVGEIKIFFEPGVPDDSRVTFIKYVHEHLLKRAAGVVREREYTCPNPNCGKPVNNKDAIRDRVKDGKPDIGCVHCDARITLIDLIERKFAEDRFLRKVQELDAQARINIDNESRELILVGQAFAVSGEAGQIFRRYTNSDHGIDGEIEFKDGEGRATGKRLYLQLKSGDSYLYGRRRDGQEVFTIRKARHLAYWQSQAYPVYLVIRTSDGSIRWMNITEHLRKLRIEERREMSLEEEEQENNLPKQVKAKRIEQVKAKRIVFKGEPFNAESLLKLRATAIASSESTR